MGMDLSGAGGYFFWNAGAWGELLELGKEYGWVPMGTGPRNRWFSADQPSDNYYGNDAQLVYARDARNLADALSRALKGLKNPPIRSKRSKPGSRRQSIKKSGANAYRADMRDWFSSEEGRKCIRKFIRYCRIGNFRIY